MITFPTACGLIAAFVIVWISAFIAVTIRRAA